jgi:ribosomal protein L40E
MEELSSPLIYMILPQTRVYKNMAETEGSNEMSRAKSDREHSEDFPKTCPKCGARMSADGSCPKCHYSPVTAYANPREAKEQTHPG